MIRSAILGPAKAAPAPVPAAATAAAIYTCPMHPEVRQQGPGTCPICGMALEPVIVTADAPPNAELADMTRRFWYALAFALPVVVLEMGGHLVDLHAWLPQQTSNWIQLVLATPVVWWAGWPFFERGWQSLKTRNLNMFTLIAMGTGVAWIYSVVGTLFRRSFRRCLAGMTARSPCISRPPPSSPYWCCSARCWNSARAKVPAAPYARCWTSRRSWRAVSSRTAPTRTSHSKR